MFANDGKSVVMKGVTHDACDHLIKPVRIEALKNIWQHVIRKRKNWLKDAEQSGSLESRSVTRSRRQHRMSLGSSSATVKPLLSWLLFERERETPFSSVTLSCQGLNDKV
ncbi:hypothetical protein V8G54_033035 [Vigna mungo]|uniref:Response regulatory domain-containing protein n=1 Tax=Vigna mungo TaxID=3915 RepID=A0AAQ3MML8_VIGMU